MFVAEVKSKYKVTEPWLELFHGGELSNLKMLKQGVKILTPEEKKHIPSTGLGKIGLSTTSDKKIAQRYSKVFGHGTVISLFLNTAQAKIYNIDTHGRGIDEVLTDDQILDLQAKGYDAIRDTGEESDYLPEKEYRILNAKHIKV